jgi:hypothetical protein
MPAGPYAPLLCVHGPRNMTPYITQGSPPGNRIQPGSGASMPMRKNPTPLGRIVTILD